MLWKHGMIGRHKNNKKLYVVIESLVNTVNFQTAMPLEDYVKGNKVLLQLLEPVDNLEPLGELQELLYG